MERFFSNLVKKNFLLNLLILGRPWNGIIIGLFAIFGFLYVSSFNLILCFSLFFVFLLQYFAGAIVNDLSDFSTDSINTPYLPLESGAVKKNQAKILAILVYLFSFVFSLSISINLFIGVLIFFLFGLIYSVNPFRFVARGFLANLTLATVTILIPFSTGAFLADNLFYLDKSLMFMVISFSLFFVFFSISKDFKDLKGDKNAGKNTFVSKHGVKKAAQISILGETLFFIIFIFSFFSRTKFNLFFIVSSLFFIILLIIFNKALLNGEQSPEEYEKIFSTSRTLIFLYSISLLFYLW